MISRSTANGASIQLFSLLSPSSSGRTWLRLPPTPPYPAHAHAGNAPPVSCHNNICSKRAGSANSGRGISGSSFLPQPKMAEKRRADEQASAQESHSGIQGEGGPGRSQGRKNSGRVGRAVRRSSQPDHAVEEPVAGGRRSASIYGCSR